MEKILDRVNYPKDIRNLNIKEKEQLAKEIREKLKTQKKSKNQPFEGKL